MSDFEKSKIEGNFFLRAVKRFNQWNFPLEARKQFWEDYKIFRAHRKTMSRKEALEKFPKDRLIWKAFGKL